jgi:branched-chain amino acid transport system ATP-binding protein
VLEVRDLSIRFGGLQALENVSIDVNEWEIVGLIGPNGAGKTTAFNCITGFYRPDTGTVRYRGQDVTRVPPHRKAAMGFGRTFQNVGMVKSSTVIENLKTAQHAKVDYDVASGLIGASRTWAEERALAARADAILELLGLSAIRDNVVGGLSYGTLKLLELGCALATDPDVLLLDEPSSSLDPRQRALMWEFIHELAAGGTTVVYSTHDIAEADRHSHRLLLLADGELLFDGCGPDLGTDRDLETAFVNFLKEQGH